MQNSGEGFRERYGCIYGRREILNRLTIKSATAKILSKKISTDLP